MAFLVLLMSLLASDPGFSPGDEASVKVMRQFIFPSPAFYAQPVAELALGQVLTILEVGNQWYRVSATSSLSGWVHSTALASASAGSGSVSSGSGSVTQDEVTLAGRGFNSDVEAEYESDNPSLDFGAVDRIEAFEVSESFMNRFLAAGGLVDPALLPDVPEEPVSSGSGRGGSR
jgi:hypothetical protein